MWTGVMARMITAYSSSRRTASTSNGTARIYIVIFLSRSKTPLSQSRKHSSQPRTKSNTGAGSNPRAHNRTIENMNTEKKPKEIYEEGQSNLRHAHYVANGGCCNCTLSDTLPIRHGSEDKPYEMRLWCTKHQAPVHHNAFCENFSCKPSNA